MLRKLSKLFAVSLVVAGGLFATSLVFVIANERGQASPEQTARRDDSAAGDNKCGGGGVEPNVARARFVIETPKQSGEYQRKGAFETLAKAEEAMAFGDRLVVASPSYDVRILSTKCNNWLAHSTHPTIDEARKQLARLQRENSELKGHVAEYVLTIGCKLRTPFVAYRLEDAQELLAALKEKGRFINDEKLVIAGEE